MVSTESPINQIISEGNHVEGEIQENMVSTESSINQIISERNHVEGEMQANMVSTESPINQIISEGNHVEGEIQENMVSTESSINQIISERNQVEGEIQANMVSTESPINQIISEGNHVEGEIQENMVSTESSINQIISERNHVEGEMQANMVSTESPINQIISEGNHVEGEIQENMVSTESSIKQTISERNHVEGGMQANMVSTESPINQILPVGDERQRIKASGVKWLGHVKRKLDVPQDVAKLAENVFIYKVPRSIKDCKPEAYAPLVVSLGPYHHNREPILSSMDELKVKTVQKMLQTFKKDVAELVEKIGELDTEIRKFYEEKIHYDKETLSYMLAMDACFILEFFSSRRKIKDSNLIFGDYHHHNTVYRNIVYDFMKVENQIPLVILETVLSLGYDDPSDQLSKLLIVSHLFEGYPFSFSAPKIEHRSKLLEYIKPKYKIPGARHLLDLYRMVIKNLLEVSSLQSARTPETTRLSKIATNLLKIKDRYCRWPMKVRRTRSLQRGPSMGTPGTRHNIRNFTPSAKLLFKVGIKFEKGKIAFERSRFGSSKLCLCQIIVDDSTEILLRNLMAYEECLRCSWSPTETVISQYVILLQNLIDSEKDVSVLRKAEVIYSECCSDKYVARIFNDITKEITFEPSKVLDELRKEARKHYDNRYKVWMSQIKEEYFSKPWSLLSFLGAILILGLTIPQTVNSFRH
ncbi:hypothetical protein SUGI_0364930 [Cryptomeria japonica]|nr:hypothetical protein SUGI_0364930 [Cryptomeria japonica]